MKSLHEILTSYETYSQGKGAYTAKPIPKHIEDNLKFPMRPYQTEAFQRYIWSTETPKEQFVEKPEKPSELVFNMATGSGKTYIMAGLIVHLYQQGYRNFLFFVNTNNIIEKTKMNFLERESQKYLFSEKILIDRKKISINEIESFAEANDDEINIKFMTIGALHGEIKNPKENSLSLSDFKDDKFVFIADEFHHYHRCTIDGGEKLGNSWEGTIKSLVQQNEENIYLGFTATIDDQSAKLMEKLADKIVFKYDLREFRNDRYSKEIEMLHSKADKEDRIILALIMNVYRGILSTDNQIELKPTILFKSSKIQESTDNRDEFHELVDGLTGERLVVFRDSDEEAIRGAFVYFDDKGFTNEKIVGVIQSHFKRENTITMNNEKELERNQKLANTLELPDNPIRAIFAVDKLNEGWDVLNLFDIVRLHEGRATGDGNNGKPGKKTVKEAQLIGRGARYFAFDHDDDERDRRKFDNHTDHPLRILETLYYHCKDESKYITELKQALVDQGIIPGEKRVTLKLSLKQKFIDSEFFKTGKIVLNEKTPKSKDNIIAFEELGVKKKNFEYVPSALEFETVELFSEDDSKTEALAQKDLEISKIPDFKNIARYAISTNPFFHHDNMRTIYPEMESISQFIEDHFGKLSVTIKSNEGISNITRNQYLEMMQGLLQKIESELKSKITEFGAGPYVTKDIRDVFTVDGKTSKEILVKKDSERAKGQQELVSDKDWYVFDSNYGTELEKKFVQVFAKRYDWRYTFRFKEVYMIRNELHFKIFNEDGKGFQPDFVLFLIERNGGKIIQLLIEPKGGPWILQDKWKEDLLSIIRDADIEVENIHLTGPNFFTYDDENEFIKQFESLLGLPTKNVASVEKLQGIVGGLGRPISEEKEELIALLDPEYKEDDAAPDWGIMSGQDIKQYLNENPDKQDHYDNFLAE